MKELFTQLAISVGSDPNSTTTVNIPTTSADNLLASGLNLAYFIAGIVAVIVIIIAGMLYTASGGDASRVTRARNLLTYSISGLAVVLGAFIITNFVIGRFN
jgi:hypothetical protein